MSFFFSFACLHSQMADGLTATFPGCHVSFGAVGEGSAGGGGGGGECGLLRIIMKLIRWN